MRTLSRAERQAEADVREARRLLRAHGVEGRGPLLDQALQDLDRRQLQRARELFAEADAALVVAQQARTLRARLLDPGEP